MGDKVDKEGAKLCGRKDVHLVLCKLANGKVGDSTRLEHGRRMWTDRLLVELVYPELGECAADGLVQLSRVLLLCFNVALVVDCGTVDHGQRVLRASRTVEVRAASLRDRFGGKGGRRESVVAA
jgi:hypothetical protein